MSHLRKLLSVFLISLLWSTHSLAGPWFTGPLLAPAGHTVPGGHTNFELYDLNAISNSVFNNQGDIVHRPLFKSLGSSAILTHGFTDRLDVQLNLPYAIKSSHDASYHHIGDVATALGFQLLEQNGDWKHVDLRILLQEVFPTGKFEDLSPNFFGADSTGLGSYQTQIGLNFQYLLPIYDSHYLRTRLILSHLHSSSVNVHGLNSYGGTQTTLGRIDATNGNAMDLAFEYTLTQNWVLVMEGTMASGQTAGFSGILDDGDVEVPTRVAHDNYKRNVLAPAIEYNFNSHVGIITGVSFPISGTNTANFINYMAALNMFW